MVGFSIWIWITFINKVVRSSKRQICLPKMKGSSVIINLFFNMVVKGGYSTDRMKRGVVRGIKTSFYIQQLLKNCALLYMDAPMDNGSYSKFNRFRLYGFTLLCSNIPSFRWGKAKNKLHFNKCTDQ